MHKLNPNVPTSLDTSKSLANFIAAGEKPDAVKLAERSMSVRTIRMDHFRHVGQFRGSAGSPGGKVTSSTSVPSARWTTWRGATPGAAVFPDAMFSGVGSDDMVMIAASNARGGRTYPKYLKYFCVRSCSVEIRHTSTCIGTNHYTALKHLEHSLPMEKGNGEARWCGMQWFKHCGEKTASTLQALRKRKDTL